MYSRMGVTNRTAVGSCCLPLIVFSHVSHPSYVHTQGIKETICMFHFVSADSIEGELSSPTTSLRAWRGTSLNISTTIDRSVVGEVLEHNCLKGFRFF